MGMFLECKWAAAWQNQQCDLCAQRRLRSAWASAQSDQSSLCTFWVAKDPGFLHADSEDSDHTGWMTRLNWVFNWHTDHFVGFVTWRLKYPFNESHNWFHYMFIVLLLLEYSKIYKTICPEMCSRHRLISLHIGECWKSIGPNNTRTTFSED